MSSVGKQVQEEYRLEAKLPEWCVLRISHATICGLFVLLFLYYSYLRVPLNGVWEHVRIGGQIAEQGLAFVQSEPTTSDPSLPLAEGMRRIHIGWLGQLVIHRAYIVAGPLGLQVLFAVLQTASIAVFAWVFWRLLRSWTGVAIGLLLPVVAVFDYLGSASTAIGTICFSLFALVLTLPPASDWKKNEISATLHWAAARPVHWILLGCLMILWANLHASFIVGLLLLACLVLGRVMDALTRRLPLQLVSDAEFQNRVWLLELCLLATLVTPHGIELWKALCWWPDHPVLLDWGGFVPTSLFSWSGVGLGISLLVWICAFRVSETLTSAPVLMLLVAVLLVAYNSTTTVWALPLIFFAASCLASKSVDQEHGQVLAKGQAPQGMDLSSQDSTVRVHSAVANAASLHEFRKDRKDHERQLTATHDSFPTDVVEQRPLRFAFTLIAGLFVWMGFSLSPLSEPILGETSRPIEQLVAKRTPVALKQYLSTQADLGLVWIPAYWSDYIAHSAFDGSLFTDAATQHLPAQVRRDYQNLFAGVANWKRIADRYAVDTLVVDKGAQTRMLERALTDAGDWGIVYEDSLSLVLQHSRKRK